MINAPVRPATIKRQSAPTEARRAPAVRVDPAEQRSQLLVLSRDTDLVEIVRRAVTRVVHVSHAATFDHAAESLTGAEPGVLLLDISDATDLQATLSQLTQHFPECVIVVVGRREANAELMKLAASGRIFRYLQAPLCFGPARLALAAAVAQHFEIRAANRRLARVPGPAGTPGELSDAVPTTTKYLLSYTALGVGLAVVIGGIWGLTATLASRPSSPPATQAPPPLSTLASKPDPLQAELVLGAEAFAQARYLEPEGDNALEFYRNALALDPQNAEAQAGIRRLADKILERAEQSLLAENIEAALSDMEKAREFAPANPRLAFLDVQVERERVRLMLNRENDVGEQVRRLVEQARLDMKNGRLMDSPAGNARSALLQARKLDPNDLTVELAVRDLTVALTEAAREAVSKGDNERAQSYVDAARRLGAERLTLASLERSPSEAKRRAVTAAADTKAVDVRTQTSDAPPSESGIGGPALPLTTGPIEPRAAVATDSTLAAGATGSPAEILQAADLRRRVQVLPVYPRQAAMNDTEGFVDVDFTISTDGVPQDLKVRGAEPKRVFDQAALVSVRRWRFEPIVQNGVPVAKRATLRVRFQLR